MAAVKYLSRNAINVVIFSAISSFAPAAAPDAVSGGADASGEFGTLGEEAAFRATGAMSAREHLAERLAAIAEFAATFTQEIQGAQGQVLERSSGHVLLLRPMFKWVVDEPYPQIIVTEGDVLKVYDPDLEQLTIRPLADALTDTPISLLTQENVVLGDTFGVIRMTDAQGESFVITPRSEDSLYAEIRLRFSAHSLISLEILDHLGQFTEIRFEVEPRTTVLQSSDFSLEVPPGTDVIGG